MHNVKFVYYISIYMIKIPLYAIDFVGKLHEKFCQINFDLIILFSEVLCQEAIRNIIGNNLFWSTNRDTQEGVLGNLVLIFNNILFKKKHFFS